MRTHAAELPTEAAIPVHSQPPRFSQNLELLWKVSDDLQSDHLLEETPHLLSVLDTEQHVPHYESGTNLQNIKRSFLKDS